MRRTHLLGLPALLGLVLVAGGCDGDDEADAGDPPVKGVACTAQPDSYQSPTQHQLRRLDLAHGSLCRWRTSDGAEQHTYEYDRVEALPLSDRDARRVLEHLRGATQKVSGCSLMDTPPVEFFTVALQGADDALWQVTVPTERCLGFYLADPDTQYSLPFVEPKLARLLDSLND